MIRLLLLAAMLTPAAFTGCKPRSQGEGQTKPAAPAPPSVAMQQVIERYAAHVHQTYLDAHASAAEMEKAIGDFLAKPDDATLQAARQAWLRARQPYGRTEAFRFYEGPIDAPATDRRAEGPEGRLNAWPLNEAYIDYVQGSPEAGIIQQGKVPITEYELQKRNASEDEADVTTGFHAIEFLLWGQDLNPDGAGNRPVSDFQGESPAAQRRREYLRVVTTLLVNDLHHLVDEWKPGDDTNYRASFMKLNDKDALGKILTGLATLSGFELAAERIGVALDSGSQEDEQSCFSDNTHNDHLANVEGIRQVYVESGLQDLVRQVDSRLQERLEGNLKQTVTMLESLKAPIDRILTSPAGSDDRRKLEQIVALLQEQSKLFVEAGEKLGVEVIVAAE